MVLSISIRSNASTYSLRGLPSVVITGAVSALSAIRSEAIVPEPRRFCSTARSATLMSWRTLPGQGAWRSWAASWAVTCGLSQPYSSENCSERRVNSVRMSSPRDRRGGQVILSAARR